MVHTTCNFIEDSFIASHVALLRGIVYAPSPSHVGAPLMNKAFRICGGLSEGFCLMVLQAGQLRGRSPGRGYPCLQQALRGPFHLERTLSLHLPRFVLKLSGAGFVLGPCLHRPRGRTPLRVRH